MRNGRGVLGDTRAQNSVVRQLELRPKDRSRILILLGGTLIIVRIFLFVVMQQL